MSRIDFYMLATGDLRSRWVMACRLVEKAYTQGHRVYLHAQSEADSLALNDLLWTFRQGSFVPHELAAQKPVHDAVTPVLIGHPALPVVSADVLINLAEELPTGYDHYPRVLELIDQTETVKQQGRTRYRAYKAAGHELHNRDLSQQDAD